MKPFPQLLYASPFISKQILFFFDKGEQYCFWFLNGGMRFLASHLTYSINFCIFVKIFQILLAPKTEYQSICFQHNMGHPLECHLLNKKVSLYQKSLLFLRCKVDGKYIFLWLFNKLWLTKTGYSKWLWSFK